MARHFWCASNLVPVRTHDHREFSVDALLDAKGDQTISVCLPARDEAETVGGIVATVLDDLTGRSPLVDEVLVIDDGSSDATATVAAGAGARVVRTADVLPEVGEGAGKGEALWKSLAAARGGVVVWCDADVRNFGSHFVTGLLGPLLTDDGVSFVKAFYDRPAHGRAGEGGRVTELVARPLLATLFPHLAAFEQPLAGEYAGRRSVLERVPFVQGWGVELALLVDVAALVGTGAMAQVDLGVRVHRNRPLDELVPQAEEVLRTALSRAGVTSGVPERPPLVRVTAPRLRTA
jgi:glucosyl-3-phosphoglycerate synthase